jgi:hypothetical protein
MAEGNGNGQHDDADAEAGDGLNERQRRFVAAYFADPNATEAARQAGYQQPQSQGPRLLKNVAVQSALEERRRAAATAAALTPEMVIDGLLREARREKGGTPAARVKAWHLLGIHQGMFPERRELTGKNGGAIEQTHHHDADDLARLAPALAAFADSLSEGSDGEVSADDRTQ